MVWKMGVSKFLSRNMTSFVAQASHDNAIVTFARNQSVLSSKLVYSEYGDPPKVVRQEKEELRNPAEHEVMIRMLASPVNPADINTIQGVYAVKPKLPSIPGNEGVGEIADVGNGVTDLKVGDRVVPKLNAWGTWRTHAVCKADELIKISDKIGIVEAATLTVNPCTAYRMLKDFVPLSEGDSVIQNGANSAAGQNVIQLCKAWGIKSVNIVRNRSDIDELKKFLTELGATYVLTEEELRTTDLFKKGVIVRPTLALNCVGGKNALEVMRHLDSGGVMVTYGGMSREPVTVPTSALIFKNITVRGYWMTRWSNENANSPERSRMFEELTNLIIERKLNPPKHTLIGFERYKEALSNAMSTKGFVGMKYIFDFQK
ncbi:enoyl-[acyl-carrier-protein] reductase, mitochondrial [Schistocerca nitens]|uniref:enoyl-[acyl-carrier-protein] reductase, mitochondrial n=1 Tax=Schistocerca nitens TaxID=7011 RepID=UPI002117A090|nr:enoyl-[acyl-carrier-protein] reductase, mitochondrial [Schistocerca nitens]